MISDKIYSCVKDNKSVLVYKEDVHKFLPDLSNRWTTVYIQYPVPPKQKLIDICTRLGVENKDRLRRKTIEELKELLEAKTKNKKVVIMFNHFEKMTQLGADTWGFLNRLDSIIIVASYYKSFKSVAYELYQQFEHIREETHEEIDIKYSIFAILSALCIFLYMKIATMNVGLMAFTLLATIWFGLLIFRTFIYIGRG